jgi:hypothetical protein
MASFCRNTPRCIPCSVRNGDTQICGCSSGRLVNAPSYCLAWVCVKPAGIRPANGCFYQTKPTTAICRTDNFQQVNSGRRTKFFMSSVGRRCCAAQIQGRAAALPYRGGEESCLAPVNSPQSLATSSGARSSRPPPSASRRRLLPTKTRSPFRVIAKHFAKFPLPIPKSTLCFQPVPVKAMLRHNVEPEP